MKRSRINEVIKDMEALIKEHGFEIPPFAKWGAKDWESIGHEYDEIRENQLGWDITDYGLGRFDQVGFALLTIRNGNQKMPEKYPKPYAEKLLMLYEGQTSPMHYHWNKLEDIINRGGNDIYITVYNGAEDGSKTGGAVLLGEVSMCNDDENDNCFYEQMGRFPEIEEDEPPYRLLCNEYPEAK